MPHYDVKWIVCWLTRVNPIEFRSHFCVVGVDERGAVSLVLYPKELKVRLSGNPTKFQLNVNYAKDIMFTNSRSFGISIRLKPNSYSYRTKMQPKSSCIYATGSADSTNWAFIWNWMQRTSKLLDRKYTTHD